MQKGFANVEEYLVAQPEPQRRTLEHLRQTIKNAAPEAQEVISYSMPAYKYFGMVAYFAAAKNHCGFYIRPSVMQVFKERLGAYKLSKATIQFPWKTPLPVELITEIIRYTTQHNREEKAAKDAKKQKKA